MLVESPTEPKWSPKGELFFLTDRGSGFWNIYKWVEHTNEVISVYTLDAEFTRPLWVFGISSYGFLGESNHIVFSYRFLLYCYTSVDENILKIPSQYLYVTQAAWKVISWCSGL
jgi:hypothetical protein